MTGQMKRYKMELTYGVELAGPVSVGTGATLQESSSDFDSSKPLESVRAAAECFALLVNDFSTNAVPNTLREEFLLELARKLKWTGCFALLLFFHEFSPRGLWQRMILAGLIHLVDDVEIAWDFHQLQRGHLRIAVAENFN
jgi:hypothetical protein